MASRGHGDGGLENADRSRPAGATKALADEDVVVRLGYSRPAAIQRSARNHELVFGVYGVSVYCLPGMSAEEIAATLPHPHDVFRASTVGRLRRAGFELTLPEPDGHCLVVLDDADEETCRRLERCFDAPRPRLSKEVGHEQ